MLSLEQVEEGRRLRARRETEPGGYDDFEEWLEDHTPALLDAAERVARQEAYANEPDGYDTPDPKAEADRERGRQTREREEAEIKRKLAGVLQDIEPVLAKTLKDAPILTERGAHATNPHAWSLERIEAWLLARGVRARVAMVERRVTLESATLVNHRRPRCEECAGDLGGESFGRIENHVGHCARLPL
jgi:hypothetical protein